MTEAAAPRNLNCMCVRLAKEQTDDNVLGPVAQRSGVEVFQDEEGKTVRLTNQTVNGPLVEELGRPGNSQKRKHAKHGNWDVEKVDLERVES